MSTKPKVEESDFYIHPYDHDAHLKIREEYLKADAFLGYSNRLIREQREANGRAAAKAENAKWIVAGTDYAPVGKHYDYLIQDDLVEIKKEKHMGIIRRKLERFVKVIVFRILDNWIKEDLPYWLGSKHFIRADDLEPIKAKVAYLLYDAKIVMTTTPAQEAGYRFKKIETPRPAKKKGKK